MAVALIIIIIIFIIIIAGPQYQLLDRKKRRGKITEDYGRPASPTPSNTGSARSFQRDTEKGIKVLRTVRFLRTLARRVSPEMSASRYRVDGARRVSAEMWASRNSGESKASVT